MKLGGSVSAKAWKMDNWNFEIDFIKTAATLSWLYSFESPQRGLSNEYNHDRVAAVLKKSISKFQLSIFRP